MDCRLCKRPIEGYDPLYNHLVIDQENSAEICMDCSEKFMKWQQKVLARLFPTKAAKNRFNRD